MIHKEVAPRLPEEMEQRGGAAADAVAHCLSAGEGADSAMTLPLQAHRYRRGSRRAQCPA